MKRVLFAAVLLLTTTLSAATSEKAAQIDKMLHAWHEIGMLNGVVLVADHGKLIYSRGFGYANFEWKIPNTPDTRFRIGSVTKPFTTILVLQLVQRGKIKLDAPIADYLPDYRKDTSSRVTVRHLLTHTSGIPTYIGKQIEDLKGTPSRAEFVRDVCSGDLQSEPGTKWSYNNCGYFLLGDILERVSGKSYEQLLQENITRPAGMTHTGVDRNDLVLEKRATGYDKSYVRGLVKAQYTDLGTALGAGDMYSTAEDMWRFEQAINAGILLAPEMQELMFKPTNEKYATGWFTHQAPKGHPAEGHTIQSHEGNIWGFFTNMTRIPQSKTMVLVIDNTHLDVFDEITEGILDILYKGHSTPPKPLAAILVAPTILKDGAAAGIAQYRELKRTQPEAYDFSGLFTLANDLLTNGRPKDAIEVFKLNLERNPDSWGSYYRLGDAYRQTGEIQLAIAAYENSLKKFPNNFPSVQALKELRPKPSSGN